MQKLDQMAAEALSRDPDTPAIEFREEQFFWGDMRRVADHLNRALDASGVEAGARIALVARNRPSAIAAFVALIARRHTVRMVYPFQSGAAIARNIEDIEPAMVIAAEADFADEIRATLEAKGIAAVALREMDAEPVAGFERAAPGAGLVEGEAAIEILTSGTTGAPKPFALSYDTVEQHIVGAARMPGGAAEGNKAPPPLIYFPVGNISGLHTVLPPVLMGQPAILLDRFSVEEWHKYILRYRPRFTGMPPAGFKMALDADIPPEDLEGIVAMGTGAAPLDPGVHKAFEERYGIPILLSYGATEFGGPVTAMTPDLHEQYGEEKFGTVGRALPGVKLRIVDPDTGEELPPGEEGLLEVVSPRIGPEWIRTSDLAVIDADGFMFHRGRADGAIMRGGFKVLPATIETALLKHPAVAAAAVVGLPDERLGQVPAAAVELKPDAAPPTEADLEAHLRDHVPATHIPVAWRFVDTLPRTVSLKVQLPAVKQLFDEKGTA